jgi:thymidine phosphorylase
MLSCRVGDEVGAGDRLGTVYSRDRRRREAAGERLGQAFTLGAGPVERPAIILGRD